MTPDTPTTATAAMRELLAKHPTPWSSIGLFSISDNNGNIVDLTAYGFLFRDAIVAAVNATGTGDKSHTTKFGERW